MEGNESLIKFLDKKGDGLHHISLSVENIEEALKQEPQYIQDSPVVQAMAQLIQRQAEQIQRQAEQISKLKKQVNDLKDEISRLNNTPKRPKFHPNKMEPRKRK